MNLIQQAEQLKNLPDQALVQMQQRPTDTPPYLVLAEMQRRANMRKAYQNTQQGSPMNQPPVTQQMTQQFAQGQMPANPQAAPQQGVRPPGMASGGLASLANYFSQMQGEPQRQALPEVDQAMLGMSPYPEDPDYTELRKMKQDPYNSRTWEQHYEELAKKSNLSGLKAVADKYAEQETEMRGRKQGLSQILMNLGLGMAASRRPDFAGAIGEGGLNALQGYTQDRMQNQAMAERIAERRLRALESVQRHDDRLRDYAIDAARGDTARSNTISAQNSNIDLAMWKARQEAQNLEARNRNEITLAEYKTRQAEIEAAAQRAAKKEEREFDRDTRVKVAEINAKNRGARQGRAEAAPKIDPGITGTIKEINDVAESYEKQANDIFKNRILIPEAQRPMADSQIQTLRQQATALRNKAAALQDSLIGGRVPAAQQQPQKRKYTPQEILEMFKPRGQ